MAFCTKCGTPAGPDVKFCGVCGNKIEAVSQPIQPVAKNATRRSVYEGVIHKCPNCGTGLASFVKNCPECGYEIRDAEGAESVNDFARSYANATTNDKKVDLIRTFVIPNTKEDILEFVVLASSNINTESYNSDTVVVSGGCSQQDVSEAWMAKFEQAYQKAALLLPDSPEFKRIEDLYNRKKSELKTIKSKAGFKKQKKLIICAILVVFSLLMFVLCGVLDMFELMLPGIFGIGILEFYALFGGKN